VDVGFDNLVRFSRGSCDMTRNLLKLGTVRHEAKKAVRRVAVLFFKVRIVDASTV
jgi:hypothetical protein